MNPPDAVPDSILRHRPFVFYWSARTCAAIGFQMLGVAVAWQMYALTGSAFDLGLVGLVQFLPMAAFMLVAGQVADRYDRRRLLQICQTVEGLAAAALAIGSVSGWVSKEFILAAVFVFGVGRAFEAPTQQTLLPAVVPVALFPRAVAASASTTQLATIAGPAIGGILYAFGPTVPYTICGALFLASAVLLAFVRIERFVSTRAPISFEAFFAGISYIRRNPIVLGVISLDLFAVLLGGATALLPIFADEVFHIGPEGLGLLRAAPAIGALVDHGDPDDLAAHAPRRPHHVRERGLLRACDHRVRAVEVVRAVDGGAGGAGRIGRGERGDPHDARPARDPRRHARPRQRREFAVRRHLQSARRFPRRRHGGLARRHPGGPGRRHRHPARGADLGARLSGAPPRRQLLRKKP